MSLPNTVHPFRFSNPDKPRSDTSSPDEQRQKEQQRKAIVDHQERMRVKSEVSEVWDDSL